MDKQANDGLIQVFKYKLPAQAVGMALAFFLMWAPLAFYHCYSQFKSEGKIVDLGDPAFLFHGDIALLCMFLVLDHLILRPRLVLFGDCLVTPRLLWRAGRVVFYVDITKVVRSDQSTKHSRVFRLDIEYLGGKESILDIWLPRGNKDLLDLVRWFRQKCAPGAVLDGADESELLGEEE